ncbi:MAG: ABC transporter ATP-binding protein, partial [bacterium]
MSLGPKTDHSTGVYVSDLRVELRSGADITDEVSLTIAPGEIVALVGESGSGKTTVALALLGHARKGSHIASGNIEVGGVDVTNIDRDSLQRIRGNTVTYVPQEPSAALNPARRIGVQLDELLVAHEPKTSGPERGKRVSAALKEVELPQVEEFLRRYPHQLSGGQQQRVCIAMAFILRPVVIVLDEPTTGLDVTTQAHILETTANLCRTHGVAALYVTHDLAIVWNLADRVMVMYAGRIVESGDRDAVFDATAHPYTRSLIDAIPDVDRRRSLARTPGLAPPPGARPEGCSFAPRCRFAEPACLAASPPEHDVAPGHATRCIRVARDEIPRASLSRVVSG